MDAEKALEKKIMQWVLHHKVWNIFKYAARWWWSSEVNMVMQHPMGEKNNTNIIVYTHLIHDDKFGGCSENKWVSSASKQVS